GGSLTGGFIIGGDIGAVMIGHDVHGSGDGTGLISTQGKLAALTIGGSLLGGTGNDSGEVFSAGDMGPVKIVGDVRGATGFNSGALFRSGSVHADQDIGAISVGGSLLGNAGLPVIISAVGQPAPTTTVDLAVKSLTVGGRVEFTSLQIGYNKASKGKNADAQ